MQKIKLTIPVAIFRGKDCSDYLDLLEECFKLQRHEFTTRNDLELYVNEAQFAHFIIRRNEIGLVNYISCLNPVYHPRRMVGFQRSYYDLSTR